MRATIITLCALFFATSCAAIPVKGHEYRRYRLVFKDDHVEACFSYCAKYKKVIFWDARHTTNNCLKRADICVDTRDQKAMKENFPDGWVVIKESRIL